MIDDLVEHRGFGGASSVVLELFLLALPFVSPEHRRQNREKAVGSFLGESERDSEEVKWTPFFGQVFRGDLRYLSKNGGDYAKERRCR